MVYGCVVHELAGFLLSPASWDGYCYALSQKLKEADNVLEKN